jgi:hypothetical protein
LTVWHHYSSADTARRQRGRIFRTLMSGLERARRLGATVRTMTLTLKRGVVDAKCFAHWFQTLRKRIEHKFGFCLEYCSVLVDDYSSDGLYVHAHILFTVRSLVSGLFLGRGVGFIPFQWLRDAWNDITKHSSVVYIQKLNNNPKRLARYFVAQYFSGQSGGLRLCYSFNWVFRGFCKVWRRRFAPRYVKALSMSVRGGSDKSISNVINKAKARILRDWHNVLGMDMSALYKKYPDILTPYVVKHKSLFSNCSIRNSFSYLSNIGAFKGVRIINHCFSVGKLGVDFDGFIFIFDKFGCYEWFNMSSLLFEKFSTSYMSG